MKSFIKIFTIVFFILVALTSLINIVINPFGYYGNKQYEIILWNERWAKFSYIKQLTIKPEAFILGSSNSLSIKTSSINKWTGYNTFNLGVYQGSVEDFYCLTKGLYEIASCKPKLILLCIDDWNLADKPQQKDQIFEGTQNRLAFRPELARFLPDYSRRKVIWGQFSTSLSYEQSKISFQNICKRISSFDFQPIKNDLLSSMSKDGERILFPDDNNIDITSLAEAGKYPIDSILKKKHIHRLKMPDTPLGIVSGSHEDFKEFSNRRIQLLEELFEYLNERDCKIIINIMPLQPYYQHLITQYTNYEDRISNLKLMFENYKNKFKNIILIKDNHKVEFFNGSPDQFFDSFHVTSTNSELMIKSLKQDIPDYAFQ